MITDDFKWKTQVRSSVIKANKMIGILKSTFKLIDKKSFLTLYKTFVRPQLEFGIQAWRPYQKNDIKQLEKIQRKATKLLPYLKNRNYEDRLKELGLTTLETRRERGDLLQMFKVLKGIDIIDQKSMPEMLFENKSEQADQKIITRGHDLRIKRELVKNCRLRFHFLYNRIANAWNELPQEVVSAPNINCFKNRLDRHLSNRLLN